MAHFAHFKLLALIKSKAFRLKPAVAQASSNGGDSATSTNAVVDDEQLYWLRLWTEAMRLGIGAVQEYGRAKPGQRSVVDPLTAIERFLRENAASARWKRVDTASYLKQLVDVTYKAVEATAHMVPRVGRASYVDASLIHEPDAGSAGVGSIVYSIYKAYLMLTAAQK